MVSRSFQLCGAQSLKSAAAKLAISIARKLGSLIFLTPEDIVERRAKLVMTFVGR